MAAKQTLKLCFYIVICALCSCGPDTSGISLDEAGLTRVTLTQSNRWAISGLKTPRPKAPLGAVIFIHGTPGSASTWMDMLAATPSDVYAVALDRPGYGYTTPNDEVTDLSTQAKAVIDIARSMTDDPATAMLPIVLVGHSYGAPVAAQAAKDAPNMFSGAVLAAGALDPSLEDVHWAQRLGTWQPFKVLIGHTLRTANAELIALEDELIDLRSGLGSITTPIYIIHGTADDLVPIENVPYMQAQFSPKMMCETLVLEGQNHFLPWNQIEAFWALIRRALSHKDPTLC